VECALSFLHLEEIFSMEKGTLAGKARCYLIHLPKRGIWLTVVIPNEERNPNAVGTPIIALHQA
jgi:hypothetical protein